MLEKGQDRASHRGRRADRDPVSGAWKSLADPIREPVRPAVGDVWIAEPPDHLDVDLVDEPPDHPVDAAEELVADHLPEEAQRGTLGLAIESELARDPRELERRELGGDAAEDPPEEAPAGQPQEPHAERGAGVPHESGSRPGVR